MQKDNVEGIGKHVEQVMKDVKEGDKCECNTTTLSGKEESGGAKKT